MSLNVDRDRDGHCYGRSTVEHEFGHAMGFEHEHSRPDRDEHIDLYWDRIRSGEKDQLRKMPRDWWLDQGYPYDERSVMHYGSKTGIRDSYYDQGLHTIYRKARCFYMS